MALTSVTDKGDFFNVSGASGNWTRNTDHPSRKRESQNMNVTAKTSPLQINLYNFEDPQFEDSRYVMTSPRSLEACSRLGIKPVELLHKPLLEFEEELLPDGASIRTIYELYDAHETERQNKLQLCREERALLLQEEEGNRSEFISPTIVSSPSRPPKMVTLSRKSTVREMLPLPSENTKEECDSGLEDEGDDKVQNSGSLQRQRTAWTTSIGHDRVSPEELDKRAKELHETGKMLSKVSLQSRPKRKNR